MGCDSHLSTLPVDTRGRAHGRYASFAPPKASPMRLAGVTPTLPSLRSSNTARALSGPVERTRDFSESGRQTARRQKRGGEVLDEYRAESSNNDRCRSLFDDLDSHHHQGDRRRRLGRPAIRRTFLDVSRSTLPVEIRRSPRGRLPPAHSPPAGTHANS